MKCVKNQVAIDWLPPYARSAIEQFRQREQLDNPDRVDRFTPEGARQHGWQSRSSLLFAKFNDGSESDQAGDEPGRIRPREEREIRYAGHLSSGEMVDLSDQGVRYYRFGETRSDYLFIGDDGTRLHEFVELAGPQQGFRAVIHGSQERPPRWQPSQEPRSPACTSLVSALEATGGWLKEVYLTGEKSLIEVRSELMGQLQQGLKDNGLEQLASLLERPRSDTPSRIFFGLQGLEKARGLRSLAADWMALEELPESSADSLVRTVDHYLAPGTLQLAAASREWDIDRETGLPVADAVVVGAGPGGLATGYHLSEAGQRTVLFEAGRTGQAFSDEHAKPVHALRTDSPTSNLIYTGDDRVAGVGVSKIQTFAESQALFKFAHQHWTEATGERFQGLSPAQTGVPFLPTNRVEEYDHLNRVALGLAQHYPDTFLCEKAPVTDLEVLDRDQGKMFRVQTATGHEVLARPLVMATGFVGTHGEHARGLSQLKSFAHQSGAIWLGDDHDEMAATEGLVKAEKPLAEGRVDRNLIASDRMLGKASLRHQVKNLPPGSRVAVVGGGRDGQAPGRHRNHRKRDRSQERRDGYGLGSGSRLRRRSRGRMVRGGIKGVSNLVNNDLGPSANALGGVVAAAGGAVYEMGRGFERWARDNVEHNRQHPEKYSEVQRSEELAQASPYIGWGFTGAQTVLLTSLVAPSVGWVPVVAPVAMATAGTFMNGTCTTLNAVGAACDGVGEGAKEAFQWGRALVENQTT